MCIAPPKRKLLREHPLCSSTVMEPNKEVYYFIIKPTMLLGVGIFILYPLVVLTAGFSINPVSWCFEHVLPSLPLREVWISWPPWIYIWSELTWSTMSSHFLIYSLKLHKDAFLLMTISVPTLICFVFEWQAHSFIQLNGAWHNPSCCWKKCRAENCNWKMHLHSLPIKTLLIS